MKTGMTLGERFAQRATHASFPKVHFVDQCPSTSDIAKDWPPEETPHGLLVVAGDQTQGRGRHGRRWITHDGTLAFSIALTQKMKPQEATAYTFLAGAALLQACSTTEDIVSKWPNDILIREKNGMFKKVAGILVEATSHLSDLTVLVVGIGINLRDPSGGFPPEVPNAASLALEKEEALTEFFDALAQGLLTWVVKDQALARLPRALALLSERSAMKNREIEVLAGEDRNVGFFDGFGEDGALLLRLKSGEKKEIRTGDVFFHGYDNA